jgi:hypothetical protein
MEYHTELHRIMQSFRHFSGDNSITQPFKNEFIPYHLIISKHKCHKICVSCFVPALYSVKLAFSMTFEHLYHRFVFKGDTKSPQFFNQLFKGVLHEGLND